MTMITMKTRLTRKQFDETELTPKAFDVYSNSSFVFWQGKGENYYYSDTEHGVKNYIGKIQNVNEFLESLAEGSEVEC